MKKFSIAVLLAASISSVWCHAATILAPLNTTSEYWTPLNLVEASDGNFYGTGHSVQKDTGALTGFVFKLSKDGTHTKLHSFDTGSFIVGADTLDMKNTLIEGDDGYIYGVTAANTSVSNGGTFYRMAKDGTYQVIQTFDPFCSTPACGLHNVGTAPYFIWKEGGVIYGVTMYGGGYSRGTLFKYDNGVFSVIRHFSDTVTAGALFPQALNTGFIVARSGNTFYTYKKPEATYSINNINGGVLSKVTIQSGTQYSIETVHTFSARTGTTTVGDGFTNVDGTSIKWMHVASNGNVYGESVYEGANGYGAIFKISAGNNFSIIRQNSLADWGQGVATSYTFPVQETSTGSLLIGGRFSLLELNDAGVSIKEAACPDCFVVRGSDKKGYGFARSNFSLTDTNYAYKWGVNGSFYTIDMPDTPPVVVGITPELTFDFTPTVVTTGDLVTISWSTINATSCSASGSWAGAKATAGSTSFVASVGDKNYVLTCSSGSGEITKSINFTVTDAPVIPPTPTPAPAGPSGGSFGIMNLIILAALAVFRKVSA